MVPGVSTPVLSRGPPRSSVIRISTTGLCPGATFVTEAILKFKPGRMYVSTSEARNASFWLEAYAAGTLAAAGALGLVCVTGVMGTATRPARRVRAERDTNDIVSLLRRTKPRIGYGTRIRRKDGYSF